MEKESESRTIGNKDAFMSTEDMLQVINNIRRFIEQVKANKKIEKNSLQELIKTGRTLSTNDHEFFFGYLRAELNKIFLQKNHTPEEKEKSQKKIELIMNIVHERIISSTAENR